MTYRFRKRHGMCGKLATPSASVAAEVSVMQLRSARDGLWLVIDLVDDLLEVIDDPDARERLAGIRSGTLDLLFAMRKLEAPMAGKVRR